MREYSPDIDEKEFGSDFNASGLDLGEKNLKLLNLCSSKNGSDQ